MKCFLWLLWTTKFLFKSKCLYIAGLFCFLSACKERSETFIVNEKGFSESVYASGEIFPSDYYFLESNTVNRILAMYVSEGDVISKDDVILLFGSEEANQQVQIIQQQITLAKENLLDSSPVLNELVVQIELAQTQHKMDSIHAGKYKELALSNAVSQREADQAEMQYQKSNTEYRKLNERYSSIKRDLQHSLSDLERQLLQVRQTIQSPITGKVYAIEKKTGELASPGEHILLIGTDRSFKLELQIDERDIQKIKEGQLVFFETDACPNKQYSAVINRIHTVLQKSSRSFKVEAIITDTSSFYPQSSVEANIVISQNKQAILIPADYLLTGDSVFIQSNSAYQKRKIETGAKTKDWIEIVSGLVSGDVIIKPDGDDLLR